MAVGELARRELSLEFSVVEEGAPRPSRNHPRKIVLYVHLSQDVLTARLEHGNHLITPGQLRDLCGAASQVVVKPVLDPTAHDPVDTRVVPDRHRELIAVRDQTCVFPWCTRPARSCDADHTIPAARGGPTCPCNRCRAKRKPQVARAPSRVLGLGDHSLRRHTGSPDGADIPCRLLRSECSYVACIRVPTCAS